MSEVIGSYADKARWDFVTGRYVEITFHGFENEGTPRLAEQGLGDEIWQVDCGTHMTPEGVVEQRFYGKSPREAVDKAMEELG